MTLNNIAALGIGGLCLGSGLLIWLFLKKLAGAPRALSEMEAALAQVNSRTKLILESVGEGIYGIDQQGRITFANPAAAKLLGYEVEELLGQPSHDLFHGRHADGSPYPMAECPVYNATSDGKASQVFDEVFWRKDGSSFPVEYYSSPLWEAGAVVGVVSVFKDITARKAAEEALQTQLLFHQVLIDTIPSPIFYKDLAGRYLGCNKSFESIFACVREHIVGKSVYELAPKALADKYQQMDQQLLDNPGVQVYESSLKYADGSMHQVVFNKATYLGIDGAVAGLVGIILDVTERKQVEEAVKKARDIALASASAKSEFLANMSHELRTPMNGIIGMTELVLDTELSREQREYLELAKQSADALLLLLNDILDFSKIEAGRLEFESAEFDLAELVHSTVRTFSLPASRKGIDLVCTIEPDLPLWLRGDPGRLRQVIVNLVGNAIKFTECGEIKVMVQSDGPVGTTPEGMKLHVTVHDTGIGIAADKIGIIFDSFSQADGSTTRKYGGTGLGLAISKQIIELMGGTIWVESAVGSGSSFHFAVSLPPGRNLPEQGDPILLRDAADSAVPAESSGGIVRILLAEDNPVNQLLAQRVLEKHGYRVTAVGNGSEAVAAYRTTYFDLLLMDVQMPEMDGFEATAVIRDEERGTGRHVPIIAMTAHAMKGDRERCLAAGMDDYITKPLNVAELLAASERHCRQNGEQKEARACA